MIETTFSESIDMVRQIHVELLPHERAALLRSRWTIEGIRTQLEACADSADAETIIFTAVDLHLLSGDLNYEIVKKGCRDADIIDLSYRFDYIDDTGDGSLHRWEW